MPISVSQSVWRLSLYFADVACGILRILRVTQAGDQVSFKVEPSEKGTVATEVTVQVSSEEASSKLIISCGTLLEVSLHLNDLACEPLL